VSTRRNSGDSIETGFNGVDNVLKNVIHADIPFILKNVAGLIKTARGDKLLRELNAQVALFSAVECSFLVSFKDTRSANPYIVADIPAKHISFSYPAGVCGEPVDWEESGIVESPTIVEHKELASFLSCYVPRKDEDVASVWNAIDEFERKRKRCDWILLKKVDNSYRFYFLVLPAERVYEYSLEPVMNLLDFVAEFALSRMRIDRLNLELERHSAVIEAQESPFFLIVDGRIEFHDSALPELLGAETRDLKGKDIADYLDTEDARAFKKALETYSSVASDSHIRRYYRVYRTVDGSRELEISMQPVSFLGKSAIRGVVRDRNTPFEIERMAFDGKHLESLATLAGGIAHDFNNLLGAILGYTSLIRNSIPADSEGVKFIEKIEEAGARAVKLARQLLFISREGRYKDEVVNLREILTRVSKSCIVPMDRISVVEEIRAEDVNVRGDPTQIYEAFLNLCMNAREAMESGGKIQIEVDNVYLDYGSSLLGPEMREGEYVRVKLKDAGSGMKPEILRKAPDPFFTTKRRYGRRGLGLPVSIGIIENHGGRLLIKSKPGEGTEVMVLLPVTYSEISEVGTVERKGEVDKLRVLVVDDEKIVCGLVQDMLNALGIEAVQAYSGREALELISKEDFNLVILDLVMPEMNGREVFYRLRETHRKIPVVISSGYTDETIVRRLLSDGAVAFLKKPYVLEDLEGVLEKVIARRLAHEKR